MQVILTKSLRKLGKVGDLVKVANGYARNYLIPQQFAIKAVKSNLEKLDNLKRKLEEENENNLKIAKEISDSLDSKHLFVIAESAIDGKLFGSVGAKYIATMLSDMVDFEFNYSNIILDKPIKFNGVYKVKVTLHPEIITDILVVVAKSDEEAKYTLSQYVEDNKSNDKKENSDVSE